MAKIDLIYEGKRFFIDLRVCNFIQRFFGLMFVKKEKAKALLFEFKKPTKVKIHSLFVFLDFIAIWLNKKNKIVDLKIVKPFNFVITPKKSFCKLIEIPMNKRYKGVVELLTPRRKSRKV